MTSVVVVTAPEKLFFYETSGYEVKADVGPVEWLEYLQNAKAVVTDSFHGVCFSIIYNQDFIALKRFADNDKSNENARVTDLLDELGLNGHILNEGDYLNSQDRFKFDNNSVSKLEGIRKQSVDFLYRIIQ